MIKKATIEILLCLVFPTSFFGQGEASIWYFRNNIGIYLNNYTHTNVKYDYWLANSYIQSSTTANLSGCQRTLLKKYLSSSDYWIKAAFEKGKKIKGLTLSILNV